MANFFDQFDAPSSSGNFFDQFDEKPEAPKPEGGLIASLKQTVGQGIKGAGQAAADYLPGVTQDNALKSYGQEVIDANPTAVRSLSDVADSPWTATKEAVGNALGSMGAMVGAQALGRGVEAVAPFTGPARPIVSLLGKGIQFAGPVTTAALPSYGGIREQQIQADPTRADSPEAKARALAGAGAVGLIERSFGPEKLALSAMTKEGRAKVIESMAGKSLAGSIGKGMAKGAAVEGAEELVQNPVEQFAAYQDPTTPENLQETAFGGVMGALGGGVLGGAGGGISYAARPEQPQVDPNAGPLSRAAATAQQTGAAGLAQAAQQAQAAEADTQAAQPDADPLAGLSARLTPEAMRAVRAAEGYGPESVNEVLRAYQIARNPELDATIRQQATEALNGFWQGFDNRPNWTRPNPQPEQAPQPGTDVAPFGQGTDVAAPGAPSPFDPNTLGGEAQEVGTLPPNRPLLTGPEEVAQQYRRDLLEEVLADPDTRNPLSRYESVLKKNGFEQRRATPDERKLIEDRTVSRTETVPARVELPPFAAVEQSRRAAFPMTQTGAQRQAAERTQATGQAFEVVPHPTVKGRFAVQAVADQFRDATNMVEPVAAANTSPERVAQTPEIEQVAPTSALLNSGEIGTPAKSRQAELRAKMEADQATSAEIDEYISLVDQEFAVRRSGGKAQADQWFETPERARSFLTESGYQERNGAFEKDGEQRVRIAPQSTGRGGVALELDEFAPNVEDGIAEAAKLAGRTEKETRSIYRNMVEKNGKEYADDLLRKTVEKFRTQGTANEKTAQALPPTQKRGTAQQAEVDPLSLTPKQYHEDKLRRGAVEYGLSLAEVREMEDTPGGRANNEQEWVNTVKAAFRDGKEIPRATLDKLEEVRPGAFNSFLHDHPNAKVPQGYQSPQARQIERQNADVLRADRVAARQQRKEEAANAAQPQPLEPQAGPTSRPQGAQEGAQESGQGVGDDLRTKLQAVERDILAAAPPKFSVGGGDIEGAMRSLKVPQALKEQRKAIKEQMRAAQQPRSDLDAIAERVTEPTHTDPGQAPEAATAPVIREAIQKSARNTEFNAKEAKAWLLAEIDRAIADAPTMEEKQARFAKGEGNKRVERANGGAFTDFDKAIGFVTFDVPGDGSFKVLNTKETLQRFRDKAERSPGFRDTPATGFRPDPPTAGLTKREQDLELADKLKQGRRTEALDDLGNAIEIARLHGANDDPLMERFREIADKDYDAWRAEQDAEGEIAAREAGQSATPNSPEPRAEQGQQADTGADTATAEESSGVAADDASKGRAKAKPKLEDFGEKLEGAKKFMRQQHLDALSDDALDIATEPLSKTFPVPNYAKLADEGVPSDSLAFIAVARNAIPAKPRVGYKLKRWVEQVKQLRSLAHTVLSGEVTFDKMQATAEESSAYANVRGLFYTATAIKDIQPDLLPQAAKWRIEAHGGYSIYRDLKVSPGQTVYSLENPKGRDAGVYGTDAADVTERAAETIRAAVEAESERPAERRLTKLAVYSDRYTKDIFIGFKGLNDVVRLKTGFANATDARSYIAENQDALQATIDEMRAGPQDRRPGNRPRQGPPHREGDATPEMFASMFSFRGVQFGSYVEGDRRQAELNEAYDALMDLADVLAIPPKALSLNGSLGLAFGARGSGNAKAHFEPGNVVINLTKTKGAGSLAHEWLHALDNYLDRQSDGSGKSTGFLSNRNAAGAVRAELFSAWKAVQKAFKRGGFLERAQKYDAARSKPYWSTDIEMAARSFERYILDRIEQRGGENDYLVNVYKEGGAYPTDAEMVEQGITAAYDKLFETIDTRETDKGVALFSRDTASTGTTPDAIWSAVESLVGPLRRRRIVVVQSADVLVEQGILQSRDANGAQAFVKDGKAYFIAGNIQPGNERAVFLHEVGAHLGMERILSPLQRSVLLNRIKTWAAQANGSIESRIAQAAQRRVEAAGGQDADLETVAYFVEEAVKAGINPTTDTTGPIGQWFKTLWSALRTALEKLGLVNASKLIAQDVVNLAHGAANVAMSEEVEPLVARQSNAVDSVLSRKPQVSESGMDGLRSNAELLSNLLKSQTFRLHGLGGFDAPAQREVLAAVRSFGFDTQILRSVVDLIPVDVVHILSGKQASAESLLRNEAVLKKLLSADGNGSVSTAVDVADALVSAIAGVSAKFGNEVGSLFNRRSTSGAGKVDEFSAGHNGPSQVVDTASVSQRSSDTGNSGAFSPSDPRIQFSRAAAIPNAEAVSSKARDFLADVVKRPGTFGALSRTLQTQYHKATKNPQFKAVWTRAHAMFMDASRAMSRPADLAPDLLPKFDLSNMGKAAQAVFGRGQTDRADIKAVADVLSAGTLAGGAGPMEGVVWNDKQLTEDGVRVGDKFVKLTAKQLKLYKEARAAIDASLDESAAAEAWKLLRRHTTDAEMRNWIAQNPQDAPGAVADTLATVIEQETAKLEDLRLAAEANPSKDADKAVAKQEAVIADLKDTEERTAAIFDKAATLKEAGYMPLMRFGQFRIAVTTPDGKGEKIAYVSRYESVFEANRARRQLMQDFPASEGFTVGAVEVTDQDAWKQFKGVSPETVMLFAKESGIAADEVMQAWYKEAVASRSSLRRMVHRKGYQGFSDDLPRVLASFITSNGKAAGYAYHLADMQQMMQDETMPGDVHREARELLETITQPTEKGANVRGLMASWYLLGSIASAIVNSTQTLTMSLPFLSQFGKKGFAPGEAMGHLSRAYGQAFGKIKDKALADAVKRAEEVGIVDSNEVFHLYAEAMKPMIAKLGSGSVAYRARAFMTLWGAPFAIVEKLNRKSTFIAAYTMAKAQGKTDAQAFDFGERAVTETQGIYAVHNRPNWARGAVGGAILTFRQFSISFLELAARMWQSGPEGKKAAGLMIGILFLTAGLSGLPGEDDLLDLIDTFSQTFLGKSTVSKMELRNWLNDTMGKELGAFVNSGVSAFLPLDVSGRMGMGNLLPGTALFKPSEPDPKREMLEVLGVPGSFAMSAIDGAKLAMQGEGAAAIKAFAPKAVQDVVKGAEMLRTGEARDLRGRKIVDVGVADAFWQSIGFNPSVKAEAGRRAFEVNEMIGYNKRKESEIVGRLARGVADRDQEAIQSAQQDLAEWNQRNPETPILINRRQVQQRIMQLQMERSGRIVKMAPPELRRRVSEALEEE